MPPYTLVYPVPYPCYQKAGPRYREATYLASCSSFVLFWSGRGKTSYNRKRVYSPQLLSWQHAYQ